MWPGPQPRHLYPGIVADMQEIVVDDGWRDRLTTLLDGRKETKLLLAVVVVVATVSLLLWSRPAPARVAPPARAGAGASPSPSLSVVIVHVGGAVRRPGLYEFPIGSRVADAIESAGGALRSSDLDALNLAELLVDGTKVAVPRAGEVTTALPTAASSSAPAVIPLNSADQVMLETVPGIGPVTAAAIIARRTEVGAFASVDELLDVDGIGPATLEAIRPYLTV